MFDELRGGTWILGRRFHLFGSSEGDIFFRLRECLIVVAEFRGGFASWEVVFSRAEGAWMERQGSESGISSRPQGVLSAELKGRHFL